MNLSPRWIERLARHGFEAVHWSTIGAATAPDVEILAWASEHQCVVLTNDLDFSAILAAAPSVVQIRSSRTSCGVGLRRASWEMRRVASSGDPKRFNQARRPKYLFSGLTKCAECGRRVRDVLARSPRVWMRASSASIRRVSYACDVCGCRPSFVRTTRDDHGVEASRLGRRLRRRKSVAPVGD